MRASSAWLYVAVSRTLLASFFIIFHVHELASEPVTLSFPQSVDPTPGNPLQRLLEWFPEAATRHNSRKNSARSEAVVPQALPIKIQRTLIAREQLVKFAEVAIQYQDYPKSESAISKITELDNVLDYEYAQHAIRSVSFGYTQDLSYLLSEYLGRALDVRHAKNGSFEIFVEGKPYERYTKSELIEYANSILFDENDFPATLARREQFRAPVMTKNDFVDAVVYFLIIAGFFDGSISDERALIPVICSLRADDSFCNASRSLGTAICRAAHGWALRCSSVGDLSVAQGLCEAGTNEGQFCNSVYDDFLIPDAICLVRFGEGLHCQVGLQKASIAQAICFSAKSQKSNECLFDITLDDALRLLPTEDRSWSWDQFYDASRDLVWVCRGRDTGRFAYNVRCSDRPQHDLTWPSK